MAVDGKGLVCIFSIKNNDEVSRIEERFATARTLVFTPDGSKLLIGDKNLYVADFEELLKKN